MAISTPHVIIVLIFIIPALNWRAHELAGVLGAIFSEVSKVSFHFCSPQNFWKSL